MWKWMFFSILLATAPLAIAGFNIVQIYQENLKQSVVAIERDKAQIVAERTEAFFEKVISNLLSSTGEQNFGLISLPHMKGHLVNLFEKNDYFVELTILDRKGQEIFKVSKYKLFNPSDLKSQSKSEGFEVASKGEIYYGTFYLTTSGIPTMPIAVPIKEHGGGSFGVLSAKIHLKSLWNLLPQTLVSEGGSTYVVDNQGNLLAHSDMVQVLSGLKVRNLPMVKQVIDGKEGHLEFEHPSGKRYLAVYKPIMKLGWGVVVQVPVEEAYAPVRQVANTALKWILIVLGIAIIFSLFLTRKLVQPIKQLSNQMGEVSQGNLDVQIPVTTEDELGLLTRSFNRMIQDLKESQEALKKAEEKYRRIFEDSKDVVYIASADGKLLDVNQAGMDLFGYETKEELMKVDAKDIFLYHEEQKRFIRELMKEGFVKDFEVKLKRKDGTPIDVLVTSNVRKEDSGKIISYEGIIKDISGRKKMEEELVRRARELEALNEMGALVNQTLIDLDTLFRVTLEKVMSLTGFEMGGIYLVNEGRDVLERKFSNVDSPALVEDGKVLKYGEGVSGRAIVLKQTVIASIEEYSSFRIGAALIEEGIQTMLGFPLLAKGKAIGTITLLSRSPRELGQREMKLVESIGNQIGLALENAKLFSNLAKAKSQWETTFDAVTDLITIRDKDYRILRANQAACKRYGMDPERITGEKCYEVLHGRDAPCEGCYVSETLETKKPASGVRDNRYLNGIFQYYTYPVYNETGELIGVFDLAREITEEKRLEIEKEIVNNVNKILASSLDINEVVKAVRIEVNKILDSDRMSITLFDKEEEGFRFFSSEKDYAEEAFKGGVIYPLKGTNVRRVAETGMPIIISNTAESDSWVTQKILEEEDIRSSLLFPLEYKGKVIGTMNFGSRKAHHFSEAHFSLLRQIAPALAISIQNALLFEGMRKRLNELTILYEITKISTSSLNLDRILGQIINSLHNFFKFENLGILLVDENAKRLLPHSSSKGHRPEDIEKLGLHLGEGITGWVAETGEPLLVNDVRKDSRYIPLDEEILSEMCAPLKVGHKLIGVIDVQTKELNALSEDHLRLLNIAGGQIAAIIENMRLQEEIKQSEEKYRTVVEGALDGVCIVGGDYRFKYVNRKLIEIQGYPAEELIGTDIRNYVDEESKRLLADREAQRKKGMKLSPHFEVTILRKDGGMRNVEISARSIKDSRGNVNIIVIIKDITEKKKMEEQLIESEKLRALGEMASGVAHDFNNALAAILGNAQLLLYTAKDESLKESLKVIEKVARDSSQTVKRLQDFTRRRLHRELFEIDVNEITKNAIEITKPRWKDEAQGKGIHIEMVSNFEEVPPATGNSSELQEVITNMIFNAIEAMPEGGEIEIRTFQRGSHVHIQISDTGFGMTEEVKKKAFEPFFTTKPFSNTGLGLSMSYGIIKRFGGEIEVVSEVGYGTTFTIILPIGSGGKEEVALSPIIAKGLVAQILVIDDEETVRDVLFKILSQAKHSVTVAENGEEGLRLFKEKEFDLVLTDLGMPGMSGWEVGRVIKQMSPDTPVGMITGWGMEVDQAKIEENGIDFVIPKPFQFNHILKVIEEAIASKAKSSMT
jgi:PAS domain S-box-containing protein